VKIFSYELLRLKKEARLSLTRKKTFRVSTNLALAKEPEDPLETVKKLEKTFAAQTAGSAPILCFLLNHD
jgi:hypothetical protein